jgi:glycosyltransferase involved in cell wall biosynthesis
MKIQELTIFGYTIYLQIQDYKTNRLLVSNDYGHQIDSDKKDYLSIVSYIINNIYLLCKIPKVTRSREILMYSQINDLLVKEMLKNKKFLFVIKKNGNGTKYGFNVKTKWSNNLYKILVALLKIRVFSVKSKLFYRSIIPTNYVNPQMPANDFKESEIPFGYNSAIAIRGNSEKWGIPRCLDNIYSLIQKNNKISPDFGKKMKIAVVTHALPSGGAEKQSILLVSSLRRSGKDCELLLLDYLTAENSTHLDLCLSKGIQPRLCKFASLDNLASLDLSDKAVRELLNPNLNPYALELANLIDMLVSQDITEIISSLDGNNIICLMAAVILNKQIHLSFRSYAPDRMNHIHQDTAKAFYGALITFNKITFSGNSKLGNNDYSRYLNIDPSRITFIENFLDNAQKIKSQTATPLQMKSDIDVLGVFRLASEKNPFLFLNYCIEIRKFLPNSNFLIVGDGPMRGDLVAQIHDFNLMENFTILERGHIESLMDRAKVLLLTSDFEGTPNIVLEAMAKGLPVFATDVGENVNLLKDGRGYILDPTHISKDAKLISDVINNKQKRLEIGVKSKEFIAQWRDDLLIAQDFMNQF